MLPVFESERVIDRRQIIRMGASGFGALGLASLIDPCLLGAAGSGPDLGAMHATPHHAPRARRVIYLFFSGGPSHIDMFDYKPALRKIHGIELPESVRDGQRLTGMTSGQSSFPCVAPMFQFARHGEHGTWVSEILPNIASIADKITILKSLHTEAINHDPAITFINTGNQQPGRPSLGSWISYGLGTPNRDLPGYVVLISRGSSGQFQALYSRLWGSGFLPSRYQGVKLRSAGEPVLYLEDPPGIDRQSRRAMLDTVAKINGARLAEVGDPEISTRIAQYEMAFRMQTSVPELSDLSDEPPSTFELYGPESRKPGTFAFNCILARRMAERQVPFIQLFHRGWNQHGDLPNRLRLQCRDIDQAAAGLVVDLEQRGMLDDTLVVCGGEFGRTIYSQGQLTADNHGRDHHGRCFSMWMAGGGVKRGFEYGETDDFSYNIVRDPVHIRDFNATILHLLGIDHERFSFRFQGLDQRITGVEPSRVIREILA
jgi:hypothetical protein